MYLGKYFKKIGSKRYGPYESLRISLGHGRQKTLSLKKGMSVWKCLQSNPFRTDEFFKTHDEWLQKKRRRSGKATDSTADAPVRRRIFSRPVSELLTLAGYSRQGGRVNRGKKYFTQETALIRFSILSDEDRAMVKSPEGLLELELKALKLLKISSARGQKGCSYEKAFAATIYGITEA